MATDWSQSVVPQPIQTTRSDRDRALLAIASRQRQLIRAEQLDRLGFSRGGVRHRVRSGRLFVVHRGVYALHCRPYGFHQRCLATTYACGPGSLISGRPAAALLGLIEDPPLSVHVTNETGSGRSCGGIIVHRSKVDSRDRCGSHGIPCTSAARTVIDVAADAAIDELEDLLLAADSLRILNRRRLEELVDARAGQPGTRKILALITDDPAETRGRNERRMFSICRGFGVPKPLTNHRIEVEGRTFYADFCWPEVGLIVEADSRRWHGGRSAGESDADRDQLLSIAGWRVVRFTRDQIKHGRAETGRRLRALTG